MRYFLILLCLVLTAAGQDNCKQAIFHTLDNIAPKEIAPGKTYIIKYKTSVVMRDSIENRNFYDVTTMLIGSKLYQVESKSNSIYADEKNTVIVTHLTEEIIINNTLPSDFQTLRNSSISSVRDSIILKSSIDYCREKGGTKEILLKPQDFIIKNHQIKGLYFKIGEKDQLLEYTVHYSSPKEILYLKSEYLIVNKEYKSASPMAAIKNIFDASSNLLKKYKNYKVIDNRNN